MSGLGTEVALGGPVATAARRSRGAGLRALPATAKIGIGLVALFVLAAILAPLIAPADPNQIDFASKLSAPSLTHLMGTDENGRDILSRCLHGFRLDLAVVIVVTYVPLPIGVLLGATAGYRGGWLDTIIARATDIMVSFPFIVLVIAVIAIVGPGVKGMFIGIPVVSWALYARLARAEMLVIRELAYMEAATALGFSKTRIILRHGVPNLVRSSLVYSTVDLIGNLLLLASLSYLGLGPQPPDPELGAIIAEGQPYLLTAWWVTTLPGLMLVVFGVAVGMIGEGSSDGRIGRLAG
jgi:peptide/nickel transport system permease protein